MGTAPGPVAVTVVLAVLAVLLLLPPSGPRPPAWSPGLPPRRMRSDARRAAELEWVEALVAELTAGRDPSGALLAADAEAPVPVAPRAVAAARAGDDVVTELRREAASELVRGVAACWEVSAGSGAGLASSLATLADAARERERVRRELRVGVAEPRATALVLAALPLVGLALGMLLGADPVTWLLGSPPGRLVLAAGLLLELAGAVWAWRIATGLESEL